MMDVDPTPSMVMSKTYRAPHQPSIFFYNFIAFDIHRKIEVSVTGHEFQVFWVTFTTPLERPINAQQLSRFYFIKNQVVCRFLSTSR
jgi:hypothetical protein